MKKQITKKHPEGFIRINISTDGCVPNRPYFSITADLCADSTFRDSKIHACGCLHDEILSVCPELKSFVDLHLSDLDGVPMHAEANGWHWLAKAAGIPQQWEPEQNSKECFQFFCNHARVSEMEAADVCEHVRSKGEKGRETWGKYLDGLRPRWKAEADAALKLLETF